ncbi:MAG: Na+/H+ antiporter [Bacteroidota bacterium]|nr:Na+/H+ antiporter [Bacteroidota bacterium]
MVQENLLLVLSLLFAVSMLTILSKKLKIPYPIFLVVAGLLIGFIPGIPDVVLEPDFVFLIFLPPLLYSAAWNTSWKDFWDQRRNISLLAFGLVIFTSTAIAFLSHGMIPGFSLAMGFLLGGIISPPDAVAATSVLQDLKIPKRIVTILEGESLINDASSLIVFRFALLAVITGQFTFWKATGDFFLVAALGVVAGIVIAYFIYNIHRLLPTSGSVDTALTLISPYLMYITAEHFHYSGVMAVVSGGLFLSYRSHIIFTYSSRIQIYSFWETLVFLLNGMVFILIGLQLPQIMSGMKGYSLASVIFYAVVISLVTIIIRIIWVFPGAYIPRLLSSAIRQKEARPPWKSVFLVAWSGMRGVVSLSSALAVPLTLSQGKAFPQRDLILFITFIVILFTLVLQGLSLPWLIRKLNIEGAGEEETAEQEAAIRLRLAWAALNYMQDHYASEVNAVDAYSRLKERYERMIEIANKKLLKDENSVTASGFLPKYRKMLIELVAVRRQELQKLRDEKLYPDELLNNREWELDLEEARLNE